MADANAAQRARRLYPRSKSFQGAYLKGVRAAERGHGESACPYKPDPTKTWRKAYRNAWLRGYRSIRKRVE